MLAFSKSVKGTFKKATKGFLLLETFLIPNYLIFVQFCQKSENFSFFFDLKENNQSKIHAIESNLKTQLTSTFPKVFFLNC